MPEEKKTNNGRGRLEELIAEHMRHFKEGEHVSREQAVAIAFSEYRAEQAGKGKRK